MQTMIKVAAVQMVSTPLPEENKQTAARYIREAAEQGASLVLLPEYWAILGQHDTDKLAHAETLGNGPLQEFMSTILCWLLLPQCNIQSLVFQFIMLQMMSLHPVMSLMNMPQHYYNDLF